MKRPWTRPELYLLHRLFGCTPTYLIANRLGRSYGSVAQQANLSGLTKSREYLATPSSGRLRPGTNIGGAGRFKRGQRPHNAGVKGWDPGGRSHEGRFKAGQVPPQCLPLGSERINKDGILERKVSMSGPKRQRWRPVHALVWERAHGQIPAGRLVVFRDGMRANVASEITAEKLELVTRGELMSRNSMHTRYPREICELTQLRGVLNRQIRKRERDEKSNRRSA